MKFLFEKFSNWIIKLRNGNCICESGFTGTFCEENIDDCLENTCTNNSTCIDGINEFSCACSSETFGDFCEIGFESSCEGKW